MYLHLAITDVIDETNDTKTFFLKPINGTTQITYKAGQFLTLIMPNILGEVRRSYSLGSTPGIDEQLFITVKRKVNGEISRHLLDHFKEGDILTCLPPSGRFMIEEPFAETYFFIAAGSGITPVFALIKELLHYHFATNIILINQSRNEEHIIYKEQLHELRTKFYPRFELMQLFSQPLSHRESSKRLNNIMLDTLLKHKFNIYEKEGDKKQGAKFQFYLCGPPALMRMAQFTLRLIGFDREQIKKEQFVIPSPPPAPFFTDTTSKNITIHFDNETHRLQVSYPQNILDAALKEGIQLPYSCKAGRCSACAASCISGKIIMSRNEVLTDKDLEKGLVLTCVGYAVTDAELKF